MNMDDKDVKSRLLGITALAAEYCKLIEGAREAEKDEFVKELTEVLPRVYYEFASLGTEDVAVIDYGFYPAAVDEEWYEALRRNMEQLLGAEDSYLETFEEDMKYSDTPIAASISEGLADIFQALYNFLYTVKESEGTETAGAYCECRENFEGYWSQTLCNTLRALNHLRFG